MDIKKIKSNESNPRIINDAKFNKLVNSIKQFPEMLELRPIVIDENNIILGGNMRYRACLKAGLKNVPVKIAKGLTEEQKKEFIIKDNASFGEWDWSVLGNEWDSMDLNDWGIDVWKNMDDEVNKVNSSDETSEWVGMPEFESKEDTLKIVIHFLNDNDRFEFMEKYNIIISKKTKDTWSTNYPYTQKKDLSSLKYE